MKVVFMGTPEFSVPILRAGKKTCGWPGSLRPDKPKGRGGKVQMTPVKEYALSQQIPVFQPLKIRKDGLDDLKSLAPDLCVTAAFGQILSQEVLDVPKIGTVNVHILHCPGTG
ncbi:MAG: formyltransferase family protein [Lachnospiraceae bacterium]